MAIQKYSRQRELIKHCLASRYDHPTADMVYQTVREEYPNISLGTVYRNLAALTEAGEIQKISVLDGPDRFDWNEKPHIHFSCRCCHNVLDLEMPEGAADALFAQAQAQFGGDIETQKIEFYGLCETCKTSNN